MEPTITECFVWQTPAEGFYSNNDSYRVHSPRTGGTYIISGTESVTVGRLTPDQKVLFTSWLVRQRMMGNHSPIIPSNLELPTNHLRVHQRAENLLKYIDLQLSKVSDVFRISLYDRFNPEPWERYAEMLAWSESTEPEELNYLLNFLGKQAWLEVPCHRAFEYRLTLTVEGHRHLAELTNRTVDSAQAFVAMWFDPSLDDAWNKGIEPAIRESRYTAIRIDQKEHVNKIDDEIIAEIRRSKFLIADLTEGDAGTRGSVYYEAGFAHGLGIPVIFTCRKDSLEKLHFDIRQYLFIVWEKPEDLKSKLAKRISAVLGDGPRKEKP